MKKLLFVIVGLAFPCITAKVAVAGEAFESLLAAASADSTLSVVFDGAGPSTAEIQPIFSQPGDIVPPEAANARQRQAFFAMPVPEPVAVEDANSKSEKSRAPIALIDEKTELPFMKKGIAALEAAASGEPLARFFKSEGVIIKWETRVSLTGELPYARACPPKECGDKKVIYLNDIIDINTVDHVTVKTNYKEFYLTSNPTFLAVVLAHELTHLSDYKNIGSGVPPENNSVNLFLELNAWSTETYVYHQLLRAGIAPTPNWPEENYETQMVRLHLAIRDYVNGGKKPVASDFLALVKAKFNIDKHIDETTKIQRKGSMSLAGVVEKIYEGLKPSMENMEDPGILSFGEKKAQYEKYLKIRQALDATTEKYMEWRKTPPVNQSTPAQGVNTGSGSGAGSGTPGGGGNHVVNEGAQHGIHHSGSGAGSEGSEWHSSTDPHPGFTNGGGAIF